ncbi:AbiH family protein, partial [Parvimonas micra]
MKITFLIGNGFDINLGLKTKYSEFLDYYLDSKKLEDIKGRKLSDEEILKKEHIERFKKYVNDNIEFWWSKGELALGKYTSELSEGEGKRFLDCQRDFANELSKYLQSQEKNIDYEINKEKIIKSLCNLSNIVNMFPYKIKNQIIKVLDKYKYEDYYYNFISFNYTTT